MRFRVPVILLTMIVVGTATLFALLRHGFSARDAPWAVEAFVGRRLRVLAIPEGARTAMNPLTNSPEVLTDAKAHFADHCATCHAVDGSGDTAIGRNLYPPAPDMRREWTQSLSDGELFYVIHNGIRFTGMPAFGDGNVAADTESWKLVHLIRHLPDLSAEERKEMEAMTPKSPGALAQQKAVEDFLSGGDPPPERNDGHGHHH